MVGTIISAISFSLGALYSGRIITGLGIGQALAVTTVYLVEIAPPDTRGISASLLELYVVAGVMVGYFVAFAFRNLPSSLAWRAPFIVQSGVALVLAVGTMFIPFSPRWLVQKTRINDAEKVLTDTREISLTREELFDIQKRLTETAEQPKAAFQEMFRPRYLRRTLLGIFVMIGLQLNGVSLDSYAPVLT